MALLDHLLADDPQAFNAARGRHASPALALADLSGRKLSGVDFTKADLENADLSNTDLSEAVLVQARLDGADLTGADLRCVLAHGSRWRGAYLGEARLDEAELPRSDFSDAELPGVQAQGLNLAGARMRNADLEGARLPGVDLSEAQLQGIRLVEASLVGANLASSKLSKADLSRADLTEADLSEARMTGLVAPGIKLAGATLTGADLTGADLQGADFTGANLTRADLGGAKLGGAVFDAAVLREARLDGAELDADALAGALVDAATLGTPPEEDDVPVETMRFEDLDGCVAEGHVGLLWENREPSGRLCLRVVTVPLDGSWDGRAPALAEPADLVVARALQPGPLGFQAILFVKRPSGMICRITEISALGDVGSTRTVACETALAVRPAFLDRPGGLYMATLGRRGPAFQLFHLEESAFQLQVRKPLPTAQGFLGGLQPAVLCKGGVILPIGHEGLEAPTSVPDGFSKQWASSAMLGDALFLAWRHQGRTGLEWALIEPGRPAQRGRMAKDAVVGSLECVGLEDGVLLVWIQEGLEPGQPVELMGSMLPDGRPFPILPGQLDEPDELRLLSGAPRPVATVVTGEGTVCIVEVDPSGSRLVASLPA